LDEPYFSKLWKISKTSGWSIDSDEVTTESMAPKESEGEEVGRRGREGNRSARFFPLVRDTTPRRTPSGIAAWSDVVGMTKYHAWRVEDL